VDNELKDLTIPNTWEYKGHKIELKETSFDRNEWSYFVDEKYDEDFDSMEAAKCVVEEIVEANKDLEGFEDEDE